MRFLLDHDVWAGTARLLLEHQHDVVRAAEAGLSHASDSELLREASELRSVVVTRDRDFGMLVFAENMRGGVIYLRISPETTSATHAEVLRVLTEHDEDELLRSFVTVEPGRHRIRRLPR